MFKNRKKPQQNKDLKKNRGKNKIIWPQWDSNPRTTV